MRSRLTKQTRTLQYSKKDRFKRTAPRGFRTLEGTNTGHGSHVLRRSRRLRGHGPNRKVRWRSYSCQLGSGLFYVSHSRGRAQEKAFGEHTEGLARLIPRGNHFFISSFFVLSFISPFPILTDTT